jgi:hypothetical protein
MRWVGYVALWGGEVKRGFWLENLRGKNHFEDLGVDGRIILRWILRKFEGAWTGLSWLRIGTGGGQLQMR